MTAVNTPGYYAIMAEVKQDISVNRDYLGDVYSSNITWMFALCDYMWYWCGEILPGYRPSPVRFDMEAYLEESHELYTLINGLCDEWTDDDVRQVFKVLSRYDDWLKAAGMNY